MVEYTLDLRMLRPEVLDYVSHAGLLDQPVRWKESEESEVYTYEFPDVTQAEEWNSDFADDVFNSFSDRPFYLFYISAKV